MRGWRQPWRPVGAQAPWTAPRLAALAPCPRHTPRDPCVSPCPPSPPGPTGMCPAAPGPCPATATAAAGQGVRGCQSCLGAPRASLLWVAVVGRARRQRWGVPPRPRGSARGEGQDPVPSVAASLAQAVAGVVGVVGQLRFPPLTTRWSLSYRPSWILWCGSGMRRGLGSGLRYDPLLSPL